MNSPNELQGALTLPQLVLVFMRAHQSSAAVCSRCLTMFFRNQKGEERHLMYEDSSANSSYATITVGGLKLYDLSCPFQPKLLYESGTTPFSSGITGQKILTLDI